MNIKSSREKTFGVPDVCVVRSAGLCFKPVKLRDEGKTRKTNL